MENQKKYMLDVIQNELIGGKITGAVEDPTDEYFGFSVVKGKKELVVWVDRDAEGNGAGWLTISKPGGIQDG